MKRLFLVSYDAASDAMMKRIVQLVGGSRYSVFYRTSDMDDYRIMKGSEEHDVQEGPLPPLTGRDGNFFFKTLHPLDRTGNRNLSAHLLTAEQAMVIDALEEPISNGDLLISILDMDERDWHTAASILSDKTMSKGSISLCFIHRKERHAGIREVEELNRDYLWFNIYYNGVIALPPRITSGGYFMDIAQIVRHLTDLSFRPGLVNLDQADLLVTSKGGTVLILTWGCAQPGGSPAATSVKDALDNPLCDVDLSTVRKALVNVIGNKDLTLEDSLVASEVLRKRIREEARIIWGVTLLDDYDEDMEVFLILATTPMELLLHWYSTAREDLL